MLLFTKRSFLLRFLHLLWLVYLLLSFVLEFPFGWLLLSEFFIASLLLFLLQLQLPFKHFLLTSFLLSFLLSISNLLKTLHHRFSWRLFEFHLFLRWLKPLSKVTFNLLPFRLSFDFFLVLDYILRSIEFYFSLPNLHFALLSCQQLF